MLLSTISVLTFILFGAIYPLLMWSVKMQHLNRGFHRFSLGLSSIVGGIGVAFVWLMRDVVAFNAGMGAVVWLVSLIAVTLFYWNQNQVQKWVVTIPSMLGIIAFSRVLTDVISGDFELLMISLLGGLILSSALFAMILGHWYLNVVSLPISLLRSSVKLLLIFVTARTLWDMGFIVIGEVQFNGMPIPMIHFLQTFEGFFLFIALFFGTLLPLILGILTMKTIAIQSTQSATGLLYVIVISMIMADLFYKYYLVQVELPL